MSNLKKENQELKKENEELKEKLKLFLSFNEAMKDGFTVRASDYEKKIKDLETKIYGW